MSAQALPDRPLTIGEIFDRAVTLVVQQRAAVAIWACVIVAPGVAMRAVPERGPWFGWGASALLVAGLLTGAVGGATLVMLFAGRAADGAGALRLVKPRFWTVLRSYVLTSFLAGIVLALVSAPAGLASKSGFGLTATAMGLMLLAVPAVAVAAPVVLAFSLAFPTTVLEDVGARRGVVLAWSRVFRGSLLRSWLLGGATTLVTLSAALVIDAIVDDLARRMHAPWLALLEAVVVNVPSVAYGTALVTLAAIDFRVRSEGADIEAALDLTGAR